MSLSARYIRNILNYTPDTGEFYWKYRADMRSQWNGKYANQKTGHIKKSTGYVVIGINNKLYYAHHLAWLFITGKWPIEIDHINGIPSHNYFSNLREATKSQNGCNKRKTRGKSQYKGVWFEEKRAKWTAYIMVNYKRHHLGRYKDEIDAAQAYNEAAKKYHGKFARLNIL